MSGYKPKTWLSPAECVERTGLTAKALRVYERYGLVTPKRTPNGWRGYDVEELKRLNTISVLKAIGLTLKQIRTLLVEGNPPLKQVLEIQIGACARRKHDAERAEVIAKLALERHEERHELAIEELCSLVRGVSMSSIPPQIQRLLDKYMTADQQESWRQRPTRTRQGLEDMKAYARAQKDEIFSALKTLIDAGAQPTSVEVEALIDRNNQLMTQYGVRERMVKAYESNPTNFGNALNVGRDLMRDAKKNPSEFGPQFPDVEVVSFFSRAALASAHWREIEALKHELLPLSRSDNPTADKVQATVERFREICKRHYLGNPLIYAKWAPTWRAGLSEQSDAENAEVWSFLSKALEQAS